MKSEKYDYCAFFSKRFLGFSIEFIFDPILTYPIKSFVFQITLFWFRFWFVCYKAEWRISKDDEKKRR